MRVFSILSHHPKLAITGYRQLWVMGQDGKNPHLVSEDPQLSYISGGDLAHVFRWLGNGYIYFATDLPGTSGGDLFAVNPEGGQVYRLLDGVDPLGLYSTLSPDGVHIAVPPDNPLELTLRKAGFNTVSSGVYGQTWSADGKRLVYRDQAGTWLREVASGETRLLFPYSPGEDRKSTRLNSSHGYISYAVFFLKKNYDLKRPWNSPTKLAGSQRSPRCPTTT